MRFPLFFFFFNDTATTEIYTLSLHDALPISRIFVAPGQRVAEGDSLVEFERAPFDAAARSAEAALASAERDRKSTRLNSSHSQISYAVFCLKKKKNTTTATSFLDTTYTHKPR